MYDLPHCWEKHENKFHTTWIYIDWSVKHPKLGEDQIWNSRLSSSKLIYGASVGNAAILIYGKHLYVLTKYRFYGPFFFQLIYLECNKRWGYSQSIIC